MRRYILSTALVLGLFALTTTPAAAQIFIDNFQQPPQGLGGTTYLTVSGPVGTSGSFVQSGVDAVGGTRVYYGQKTNSDTAAIELGISNVPQAFRFTQNPVASGRAKLLYGYSAVSNASLDTNNYTAGHTLANLNINASTMSAAGVQLEYSLGGPGSTGTITVTLISNSEGSQQVANVTLPIVFSGVTTLSFPQAAFLANNPSINFSDIDQVVASVDGLPGGVNFAMDSLRIAVVAVPEPTVLAGGGLAALGLGGVVYRKVRTRRRYRQRKAKEGQSK